MAFFLVYALFFMLDTTTAVALQAGRAHGHHQVSAQKKCRRVMCLHSQPALHERLLRDLLGLVSLHFPQLKAQLKMIWVFQSSCSQAASMIPNGSLENLCGIWCVML